MATASRRKILEEHGLSVAPPWRQRLFWQSYDRGRRVSRNLAMLGPIAGGLLTEQALRSANRLSWIEKAWREVVPEPYGSRSRVEVFSRGNLVVAVDSAVTKFYLVRLGGAGLAQTLNAFLGGSIVSRVEYRIRPAGGNQDAAETTRGRNRTGRV